MAGFTDSLWVRIKKEKQKIKELPDFKSKAAYIWDYYKIPIIAVIVITVSLISIIRGVIRNGYDTALYVSYVNCISVDLRNNNEILVNSLNEWLDIDGVNPHVTIDGYYQIDPDVYSEENYTSTEKLNLLIIAKKSDCYIGDAKFTQVWAKAGYLADLNKVLPKALIDSLGERLVYYTDDESGESIPVGVDLADIPYMTNTLILSDEHPIFSITFNAPNPEACVIMLENILKK